MKRGAFQNGKKGKLGAGSRTSCIGRFARSFRQGIPRRHPNEHKKRTADDDGISSSFLIKYVIDSHLEQNDYSMLFTNFARRATFLEALFLW